MTKSVGDSRDAVVPQLYQQNWAGMVRLAMLLVGDRATAEDVVQDAFAKLYAGWSRLREPAQALHYVRTSVVNGSRSVLRKRKVAWRHPQVPEPIWSPEHHVIDNEEHREVLRAVHELPLRRREVLVLRFYSNLSDAEIAVTLGISEGSVRSAASRGIAALGRTLEETR